jgi:membrane-associated protein
VDTITAIEQLRGPALLGALCLLIYVEECGVPLPFAPGDLLLVVCGLAIRNGNLNPVAGVAAVYVVTVAGAMTGRELFDLAGARLVRRLAGPARLGTMLDRGARLLRKGGWTAVMLARLTPGLRITTTEVAGLLGLPRHTFLLGLAPGAAVYVAVFTGAGLLFGHAALGLVLHTVHRVGLGVTIAVAVLLSLVVAWLGVRLAGGPGWLSGRLRL